MTAAQIVEELPDLEGEDVRQALAYAAALAHDEVAERGGDRRQADGQIRLPVGDNGGRVRATNFDDSLLPRILLRRLLHFRMEASS